LTSPYAYLRSKERTARLFASQASLGAFRTRGIEHYDGGHTVLVYRFAKGRVITDHDGETSFWRVLRT
jgi:hypothetical protein